MMLSVVIITHNEAERIEKCLTSVEKEKHNVVLTTNEIILVDNSSSDNTVSIVENNFPQVKIIKNYSNRGVARARNQGVREATGEYVMFLDADAFLTLNTIGKLLAKIKQDPRIGIVAPKLVYPDGTLQYSCRRFPTLWNILGRGLGTKLGSQNKYLMEDYNHQSPREVDWVMGACQLIRKETIDDIGLLDEKYFFGYEDTDFCYRAWQGGWKVIYVPDATVIHHYKRRSARGGIFNPLKWSHFFSAMRFLVKKNFP